MSRLVKGRTRNSRDNPGNSHEVFNGAVSEEALAAAMMPQTAMIKAAAGSSTGFS
jgi:hypothetical protein